MPATPRSSQTDPLEDRFRLDSVPAGAWVTFLLSGGALVYANWFADDAHRGILIALMALAAVSGIGTLLLPWQRIVRSRWREAAFMAWTLADLALIALVAAIDGGGGSPLALAFFIPVVFTSLSYPRPAVVAVGFLAVGGYVALALASETDTGYALMFAACLASTALMAVWQARNHDRWRETLATASRTDPLTGALNRRGFDEAAATALAAVTREDLPLSLLLLDLDRFKAYNDRHGHVAGDELLRAVVERVRPVLRPGDTIARIGGDEFAILLPGVGEPDGRAIGERIAEALRDTSPHSLGLACAPPTARALDPLYRRADGELYAAKHRSRAGHALEPPAGEPRLTA